jgi:putative hydrolase of the HAD superfamily
MFLSSCYLGVRKPEPEIYRMAVDIVRRPPENCVFVDDRALNLECAVVAGIKPIHFEDAGGLRSELRGYGVEV